MRKIVISFLVSVLFLLSAASDSPAGSSSFARVSGRQILLNGRAFIIKGAAIMDDATLWSPGKKDPDPSSIEERDYAFTATGGLNTARLAVKMDYFIDDMGNAKKSGFDFLDDQIRMAAKNGLKLIIDMHVPPGGAIQDYSRSKEAISFWEDEKLKKRFIDGWRRIASRYRNNSNILAYEIMNEPSGGPDDYCDLMEKTIREIRAVDKKHPFILQPSRDWKVRKVNDENVIYSYHVYTPLYFTHQNVFWDKKFKSKKKIKYPGYAKDWSGKRKYFDRKALAASMQYLKDISLKLDAPVIVGEFGVSTAADVDSQGRWVSDVVDIVKESGLGGYLYWRQIDLGSNDISKKGSGTMAIINKGRYFSPAQFFGIRPKFAEKKPGFDAQKFYMDYKSDIKDK